jgi:hypothetical protein
MLFLLCPEGVCASVTAARQPHLIVQLVGSGWRFATLSTKPSPAVASPRKGVRTRQVTGCAVCRDSTAGLEISTPFRVARSGVRARSTHSSCTGSERCERQVGAHRPGGNAAGCDMDVNEGSDSMHAGVLCVTSPPRCETERIGFEKPGCRPWMFRATHQTARLVVLQSAHARKRSKGSRRGRTSTPHRLWKRFGVRSAAMPG